MSDLASLTAHVVAFRDERDWKQFHNAKDVSLSLLLEASELLELFQWKQADEIARVADASKDRVAEELADVLYYTLLLSHDLGIDVAEALRAKLEVNARKYPVDKARGSNKKYTEL
jgi:dCTP diphosphatase